VTGGPEAEVAGTDHRIGAVDARLPHGVTIGVEVVEGAKPGNVSALDQRDFSQVASGSSQDATLQASGGGDRGGGLLATAVSERRSLRS